MILERQEEERSRIDFLELSEVGEFGLIEMLSRRVPPGRPDVVKGIGDDAAVLRASGETWLLFTTDMLVEGVHFSFSYAAPRQVGKKALVASISDIAAMGGWPAHALVSLGVPPHMPVEVLDGIYAGMQEAAADYGIDIVGGDTVRLPERLAVNVALLGAVEAGQALYRSGAKPGDLVFVTGFLGTSAAGLYLCQHPGAAFPEEEAGFLRSFHLEPRARVQAGRILAGSGKVTAADDVSDGLAGEMHEICRASGTGCLIRGEAIPLDARVRKLAGLVGEDPLAWALYGGEDFELVFTVPARDAPVIERALAAANVPCCLVGEILPPEKGICLETKPGEKIPLPRKSFDHFRADED
jgi:thiamine-monophosphate kinase